MPRLNAHGAAVMGAGGPVSIDNEVYAEIGTCASWLTDDTIICQYLAPEGWRVSICKVGQPGQWQHYWDQGCNELTAGGGLWQAHLVGVANYGEYGSLPDYSLGLTGNDHRGYAGPGGEINIIPAGGVGIQIHSRSHGVVAIPFGPAHDVQVLGPTSAIWRDDPGGQFYAQGVPCPRQASGGSNPRYCVFPDGWAWVVYSSGAYGLIAHPAEDAGAGIVLAPPGVNAFYPDARIVNGALRACWSSGAGELPGELVVVPDVLALPWTTFAATPPVDPIAVIGRGCYCGFFEFVPPGDLPPGGVQLFIRCEGHADGALMLPDGTVIGQWVEGTSVEEIEEKAAASPAPPVAYWDSRDWPYWPTLPQPSWLCIQAYCGVNEPIADFERNMRATLDDAKPGQALALVCQVYTSNLELTTNLSGLVPVFSRLARDYPAVTLLLGFTDQGRATGLCDHPEVRPLWDELAAGIPSYPDAGMPPEPPTPEPGPDPGPEPPEPPMPTPTPPPDNGLDAHGVCVNPEHFFKSLVWDKPPAQFEQVFREIEDALWKYGFGFQCRSDGTPSSRLYLPTAICPNAGAVTPQDEHLGVKQDPLCWSDEYAWAGADTIENNAAGQPIGWTWQPRGSGVYVPVPAPNQPQPPEPEPPSYLGLGYLRTEFGDYLRAKKKGGELERGQAQLLTLIDEGDGRVSMRIGGSGRYVCADPNVPDDPLYANRDTVGPWERFYVGVRDDGKITLQAESSGFYVCAEDTGKVVANRTSAGGWESFTFEPD
jgi:hypothetical protein